MIFPTVLNITYVVWWVMEEEQFNSTITFATWCQLTKNVRVWGHLWTAFESTLICLSVKTVNSFKVSYQIAPKGAITMWADAFFTNEMLHVLERILLKRNLIPQWNVLKTSRNVNVTCTKLCNSPGKKYSILIDIFSSKKK